MNLKIKKKITLDRASPSREWNYSDEAVSQEPTRQGSSGNGVSSRGPRAKSSLKKDDYNQFKSKEEDAAWDLLNQ